MGKITDIERQKRNKTRVSVYIDGEYVCGLDAVTAAAARIKIGDEISPEELREVVKKSEVNSAFERSVSYLDTPHSQKEVERYLRDKGYEPDTVKEVVERLRSYHYLDDRAYAETYIKSKSKKYGSFRISAELRRRGVDPAVIDDLLDGNIDASAVDVARKYMRVHPSAEAPKLKRFLAGRGYSWDAISSAVAEISQDMGDCDGDDEYFDDGEFPE